MLGPFAVLSSAAGMPPAAEEPLTEQRPAGAAAPVTVQARWPPPGGRGSLRTRDRHRVQQQEITPRPAGVNPDASLFLVAPGSGPSGRHARADLAGSPGSAGRLLEASLSGRTRRSLRCSRSARGHSSCRRSPACGSRRTRTDDPRPAPPVRARRQNVDETPDRQDNCPAFVPGTMWGTAPRQNLQVERGAVLAHNSGRPLALCRDGRRRPHAVTKHTAAQ